jgi:hypothetical protein
MTRTRFANVGPLPTFDITDSDLKQKYIQEQKSMKDIALEFGCGETLIHKLIHRYEIPIRTRSESLTGRERTVEHANNISLAKQYKKRGKNNPNWKGGVDKINFLARRDADFITWRRRVLRLKGDKCGICGKDLSQKCPCCNRSLDKHVHHIKEFADNPELRLSLDNAIVLCESCHKEQHKKVASTH